MEKVGNNQKHPQKMKLSILFEKTFEILNVIKLDFAS
jgi:hypothetical protein